MKKLLSRGLDTARARIETRDEQGFTVLELIIVLVVLGVLMAIAIPVYGDIRHTSRSASVEAVANNAYSSALAAIEDGELTTAATTSVTAVDEESPNVIVVMDSFGGYENLERRFVCIEARWTQPDDHIASVMVGDGCVFRNQ